MADNYIERQQEQYEARKAAWKQAQKYGKKKTGTTHQVKIRWKCKYNNVYLSIHYKQITKMYSLIIGPLLFRIDPEGWQSYIRSFLVN